MEMLALTFIAISFSLGQDNITVFVADNYIKKNNTEYVHWTGKQVQQFLEDNPTLTYPTKHVVDEVWKQANCKLQPQPMNPDAKHEVPHGEIVNLQMLFNCAQSPISLYAGHKKDVIKTDQPGRIALYGWHRLNGKIIQPYSTVHSNQYSDYSHGFRPMLKTIIINGKIKPSKDLDGYGG